MIGVFDRALEIIDLEVKAKTVSGTAELLNIKELILDWGEIVGIVGESGSGKSILALTIMGLLPKNAYVTKGKILYKGEDLLKKNEKFMREKIRGNEITMIFQDPMASLNPVFTVRNQLTSVIKVKNPQLSKNEIYKKAIEMLDVVKLSDPEMTMNKYPHELSGGMRQRVLIAMALSAQAKILISDEATRALDVTIQLGIIKLIQELGEKFNLSTLFISSNMALIATVCKKINVLYSGEVIEKGNTNDIIKEARHVYTKSFLASLPTEGKKGTVLPILEGNYLSILDKPKNCIFSNRCPIITDECRGEKPSLSAISESHSVSCFKNLNSDKTDKGA
ncbi:MAG TPA: peptide ABC transporter ATP-binding protein [Clostridiales bacterium]|nr:peptide ABC transporter ATP-binding protein [Clostridiales bacterium]